MAETNKEEKPWQSRLEEILDRILNRESFSYDLNSDALYRQYADKYAAQGAMAMMDTLGRSAALTGGYGNSYGQSAGQQTYQNYLRQLDDRIPELYRLALSKYQAEGDLLEDQYRLYRDKAADDKWQAEFDEDVRRFNYKNKLGEFAPRAAGGYTDPALDAGEPDEENQTREWPKRKPAAAKDTVSALK